MGNEFEEVDLAAQRRPEGPLGVVWAVRSDGEAGTRDRAAGESLGGARGRGGEPVAREEGGAWRSSAQEAAERGRRAQAGRCADGAERGARGRSGREGSEARARCEIEPFRPQEFPPLEKLRILCQIWRIIFRGPF